ncbi:hypothetical protein ACET3Z_023427 [Daucus carota]
MAPRGQIALSRINDDAKRKASLRKRQGGILKKVSELSILCSAEAAVVMYSPDNNQFKVWPSESEARATIKKFMSLPEEVRKKNSHTARSFLEEKCRKKKNKALRLMKRNEEKYVGALVVSIYNGKRRFEDVDAEEKKKVISAVDKKKEELIAHIQKLKRKEQQTLHSPQVLLPAVNMALGKRARSGININGLMAGRDFNSPAAAHEELMNISAKRREMTRRLHEPTYLGGMNQRAPRQPEALSRDVQMPPSIQMANGLDMNYLARGRNFSSPASLTYGQLMNFRANSLSMTQNLHGLTNFSGQHPFTSNLSMEHPSLSTVPANSLNMTQSLHGPTVFSAGSVPNTSNYSLISPCTRVHIGEENFGMMKQHAHLPSLPLDYTLMNQSSNRFHMTDMLSEQMNFGEMMQQCLDKNKNELAIASLRTFIEDCEAEGLIQRGHPPQTLELPRRLGVPPTPHIQHEASSSNMIGDECGWNIVSNIVSTPATTTLDQITYGSDFRWNGLPASAELGQFNFDDGMRDVGWVDEDTAFEFGNAPPSHMMEPAQESLNFQMPSSSYLN